MISELKQYLERYRNGAEKQSQGILVDTLRKVPYFRDLANIAGNKIILAYIPLLQFYILRDGKQLVSEKDYYILLEGVVIPAKSETLYGSPMPQGFIIQPQNWQNTNFISKGDAIMLKIYRTSKKDAQLYQNIFKMTRQNQAKLNLYKRLATKNIDLEKRMQIISQAQHLKQLPQFDRYEIAVESKISIILKQNSTHERGNFCDNLGFIILGKVKIVYYDPQNPQIFILDKILQKYMKVKTNIEKDGLLNSQLLNGDWIGMQQFFYGKPYCTSGQVITQQAQILWIPVKIFDQKFKQSVNFKVFNTIKSALIAKKSILDKSINSKKSKNIQIQHKRKRKKYTLFDKLNNLSNLNEIQTKTKNNRSKQIRSTNKQMTLEDCQLPKQLFHKHKSLKSKVSTSLPKVDEINEKIMPINMFPQDFQKANIPLDMGNQIDMRDVMKIFGKNQHSKMPQKSFRQQLNDYYGQRSPQKLYKQIMGTISFKNQYQQKHQQMMKTLYKQDQLTQKRLQHMNQTFSKAKGRFNQSIYNNFRVNTKSKQKEYKINNTSKTLSID